MTSFSWKDQVQDIKVVRGCYCGDKNNCFGCPTYEHYKDRVYPEPMTNSDLLRHKKDADLAVFLSDRGGCPPTHKCSVDRPCEKCWLEWLKTEVES